MKKVLETMLLYFQGAAGSKTFRVNGLICAGIIGYAQYRGIDLSPEAATGITSIVFMGTNFILRGITGESLPEKALKAKLKKPKWASVLAAEMIKQIEEKKKRQGMEPAPPPTTEYVEKRR